MNYRKFAILFLAGCAFVSGCKTNTRLGYLIPANRNSESEKGEVVRIDFISGNKPASKVIPPTLAVTAAELGIELVKSELEKEAAKYEAQFSKTIVLSTDEIQKGGYVVLTRWVDARNFHLNDHVLNPEGTELYQKITNGFFSTVKQDSVIDFPYVGSNFSVKDLEKKHLAFMFVAEIRPAVPGASTAFILKPAYVWAWQTKAKVVDLSFSESWKVWQWIGALAFKTDNKVNFKIQPTIKALTRTKDGLVGAVPVDPLSPAILTLKHDLNHPKDYWFSEKDGALMGFPVFDTDDNKHSFGIFSIEFTVSESDASNVREYLLKGAKKLEDEKPDILKALGGK